MGFVLFGGYNEYDEEQTGLSDDKNVFGATYVFRFAETRVVEDVECEVQAGEEGAQLAAQELVHVDWHLYNAAIAELVRTEKVFYGGCRSSRDKGSGATATAQLSFGTWIRPACPSRCARRWIPLSSSLWMSSVIR